VAPGDVAFLATYDAKTGASAFDNSAALSCSNVSCHGGQATPNWQTATANAIDVPNACLSCHESGTSQYNSYDSGRHGLHLDSSEFGVGLSAAMKCKLCHDEAKVNVAGHFQNLATSEFEQDPRETILPAVEYKGNSCNPEEGGLTGCHRREDWLQWKSGGVPGFRIVRNPGAHLDSVQASTYRFRRCRDVSNGGLTCAGPISGLR
jgi:predicted CxxxxCH...CXXCH cytochrome family protein